MRGVRALTLVAVLAGAVPSAFSQQGNVTLTLRSNWNLISLPAPPADPAPTRVFASLITSKRLKSIWGYSATGGWERHIQQSSPQTPVELNSLKRLVAGHAYFVELTSDPSAQQVNVTYTVGPFGSERCVQGEWSLVGFDVTQPTPLDQVFGTHRVDVLEVLRLDALTQSFERLGQGTFTSVERGRGYWIRSNADFCLTPSLELVLEGDLDVEPFSPPGGGIGDGDGDINGNGFLEGPFEQDTISFDRSLDRKSFVVRNRGTGTMTYNLVLDGWWFAPPLMDDPLPPRVSQDGNGRLQGSEWQTALPEASQWLTLSQINGTVPHTTSSGITFSEEQITLLGGRLGLAIGHYLARIQVQSSAGARNIFALMTVPPLDGKYVGTAVVKTNNGVQNEIGKISLVLSLVQHGDELRGVIHSDETLVYPVDVPLTGNLYEPDTGRFILSGSFSMAPKPRADSKPEATAVDDATSPDFDPSPTNPFTVRFIRSITLTGMQTASGTLVGEYFETIEGLLPFPIALEGTWRVDRRALDLDPFPDALKDEKRFRVGGTVSAVLSGALTETLDDAEVVLTGSHLQLSATSTVGGNYSFDHLLPGVYKVSAAKLGYSSGQSAARVFFLRSDGTAESLDGLPGAALALTLNRDISNNGELAILASPESGEAPLKVRFSGRAPPSTTEWDWKFPGGNPASHGSEHPPVVSYSTPGVRTATLQASVGGESRSASKVIVVGPIGERRNQDGTFDYISVANIAVRLETGGMASVGGSSGAVISRNDTSPGANNATYILIGSVGAPLNGYLTGGSGGGPNAPPHLILEVGPVAVVPVEAAK